MGIIPMGIRVIPIPMQVVSHSFPFPFPIVSSIPIPMGIPWDSHSHWESHSHVHFYSRYSPALSNGALPDPMPHLPIGGSQPPLRAISIIIPASQVKLRTSNFAGTFTGLIRKKPIKGLERRERERTREAGVALQSIIYKSANK